MMTGRQQLIAELMARQSELRAAPLREHTPRRGRELNVIRATLACLETLDMIDAAHKAEKAEAAQCQPS
jgi:hypothetical protein